MYAGHQPNGQNGPRFTTGEGRWESSRSRSSGSDTDSYPHTSSHSRGHNRRSSLQDSVLSPSDIGQNGHIDQTGSLDDLPDPAPSLPYWSAKRHLTCGNPSPLPKWSQAMKPSSWRGTTPQGRLRTVQAALVLCLNIDVDPPDVVKTQPCATLECWVDPHSMPSHKALEAIGGNLQHQFEGLSGKVHYKAMLDPSHDDLKKYCLTVRRQAKDDAALFYYNGHGVPKPTASGELWCFNKDYTQYIPVSLQDVQTWLGSPAVYIWDCAAAGHLLNNFNSFAERRDQEIMLMHGGYAEGAQPLLNSIQLAACAANEQLPSCPELPADLFTSCLTSPIDMALRHYILNHQLPNNVTADMILQLPGDLKDRRTPLGELNWIFTAITDTIAWTTFSHEIFTRLYRCDLLIASLFRNFLLAERIMKDYGCTPHTYPSLPPTNTHPLWATWDLAIDTTLRQLPELLKGTPSTYSTTILPGGIARPGRIGQMSTRPDGTGRITNAIKPGDYQYVRNRFFADQLTAFEVWISRGGSALTKKGPMSLPPAGDRYAGESTKVDSNGSGDPTSVHGSEAVTSRDYQANHLVPRKPPDQLPIVLQVLLSQPHRLRALILLSQFVDLGPWAVHLVLTIGIFPYISKLLQAPSLDLRPVLIFIWARILAVDSSVQVDLVNTGGYKYFANILDSRDDDSLPNSSEHKAMCSFILASIARNYNMGKHACLSDRVFENCYDRLEDEPDFLLRQWSALCIGQLWDGDDQVKIYGVDRGTQDRLIAMLSDDATEVRAAALYALGTFMGASGAGPDADTKEGDQADEPRGGGGTGSMIHLEERIHFRMEVAVVTGATLAIKDDASPMCRKELLVLISCLVKEWRGYFVVCAWLYWEEDRKWRSAGGGPGVGQLYQPHHHYGASNMHDEDVTNQAIDEWLSNFGDDNELRQENRVLLSSLFTIFVALLDLSVDPYQEVATHAQTIVDYIMALLLESPFTKLESSSLHIPPAPPADRRGSPALGPSNARARVQSMAPSPSLNLPPPSPIRPSLSRSETMNTISSGVTNTIRRTSSFANVVLKTLANGVAFPTGTSHQASSSEDNSGRSTPGGLSKEFKPDSNDISRPPSPNLNLAQYTSPYSRPPTPQGLKGVSSSSIPEDPQQDDQTPVNFFPSDVMEALMEEDMERLRSRRRNHPNLHRDRRHIHGHGSMPSPNGSTFSIDSNSSVKLGLGTGVGIRDVLPLKSTYFDWCVEYFKEPQMRQAEPDEPGSLQYNYQVWRQQRNEHVNMETQSHAPIAEERGWDRPVTTLQSTGYPLTMVFHSYDKHLIVANESDMVSVYDWYNKKRLNYFCNGNPRGTSITSLHIVNEESGGIILTSSSEGIVRLYRNYDPTLDQGPLQMVSAFRGLNEIIQIRQGSGVVTDWKQPTGTLLIGGDSRVIKSWDASTETQGVDLETNSDSPVTSIISDPGSLQTFAASFADGVVRVFDRRLDEDDAVVRTYCEHTSWVQGVRWHPSFGGRLLSASLDGQVKLWDLRGGDQAVETYDLLPKGLSAFDVHPLSSVFAATSALNPTTWRTQKVVVHNLTHTGVLSNFNISTGLVMAPQRNLPSPYIPRLSSLVFHPTEMLYGLGQPDGSIRIIGCKLP